jgi:hypothetical protein
VLLTGGPPLYLTAHLIAGEGVRAQVTRTPPWPVDDKIVAEELSPYLAELNATMGGRRITGCAAHIRPRPHVCAAPVRASTTEDYGVDVVVVANGFVDPLGHPGAWCAGRGETRPTT